MKQQDLTLYYSPYCSFCVRVQNVVQRLNLNINYVDTASNPEAKEGLLNGGGKPQIPCLYVKQGDINQWLYESQKIVEFLEKNFTQISADIT